LDYRCPRIIRGNAESRTIDATLAAVESIGDNNLIKRSASEINVQPGVDVTRSGETNRVVIVIKAIGRRSGSGIQSVGGAHGGGETSQLHIVGINFEFRQVDKVVA